MRYRSLGHAGAVISAISLALRGDPSVRAGQWSALIVAALENGVNAFEVIAADPALVQGLSDGFTAVERRLVFVAWRLEPGVDAGSPEAIAAHVQEVLRLTDLGYLDALVFDASVAERMPPECLELLEQLKQGRHIRFAGVAGDGDGLDALLASTAFDLLAAPFSLTSGWRERNRLRSASARDMAVIGVNAYRRDFHEAATAAAKQAQAGRAHPLAGAGSYAFLDRTDGWTAEELCIGYALTEPALSTVQVETRNIEHLEALAGVPDRELPQSVPAQVEMARFAAVPDPQDRRRA